MNSDAFRAMNSEKILRQLLDELTFIPFGMYLKRYIYIQAELTEPFSRVGDSVYIDIIRKSFAKNHAPYSFQATVPRTRQLAQRWITWNAVKRDTVFLLGFGLRMSAKDVEDFLMKVLQEEGFDFSDTRETVFWYCFQNRLPFSSAQQLLRRAAGDLPNANNPIRWHNYVPQITNEQQLFQHLAEQKTERFNRRRQQLQEEFDALLYDTRRTIARLYMEEFPSRRLFDGQVESITPSDIEHVLSNGIPIGKHGNLVTSSFSTLTQYFGNKRMNRQRIETILHRRGAVTRFDLITLKFYVFSQEHIDDPPKERLGEFIEEMNQILTRCGMPELYPGNAYECFLLMCMLADDPFTVYSDIFELSYEDEKGEEKQS